MYQIFPLLIFLFSFAEEFQQQQVAVAVAVVVVVVVVVVVCVVFSSDQDRGGQASSQLSGLWRRRGNINVLGNKTHLSTAAAFPLQTRSHSLARSKAQHSCPDCKLVVLSCSMEYCGFITSCGGFNPCNNYHNSESLWWISSTYSDSSDSLEKYFRRNLFLNQLYGRSKVQCT